MSIGIRSWNVKDDLDGTTLIIDGADSSNMTFSGSKISKVNNTGKVTTVPYVEQGTDANRPTYVSNGLNGRGIIRYTGSEWLQREVVTGSHLFSVDQATIFIVNKHNTLNNDSPFNWKDPGNTESVTIYNPWGDGVVYWDAPFAGRISQGGHSAKIGWAVWTFVKNTTILSTVYYNGALLFSGGYAVRGISTAKVSTLYIGDDGNRFNGDIAEIIVIPRVLTTTEFNLTYNYLKGKWGL